MVALYGGQDGKVRSVVGRVRELLADYDRARKASGHLGHEPQRGDPFPWLGETLAARLAGRDLDEVERRVKILEEVFPDLAGVEVGPLVGPARSYFRGAAGDRPTRAASGDLVAVKGGEAR